MSLVVFHVYGENTRERGTYEWIFRAEVRPLRVFPLDSGFHFLASFDQLDHDTFPFLNKTEHAYGFIEGLLDTDTLEAQHAIFGQTYYPLNEGGSAANHAEVYLAVLGG